MALIYIKDVSDGVRIGLWRMDEEPEELLNRYPHLRRLEMPFKSVGRQREFLSVRALLMEMTGDDSLVISHEDNGRPVLPGWQLSISHTKGYAVLMLSQAIAAGRHGSLSLRQSSVGEAPCLCPQSVGVDIEYRSDRIKKIASHFIRPDEEAENVEQMLVLWCAKETLYKLYSADSLQYFEMRQTLKGDGYVVIENMKRGEQVTVHVTLTPEYCLTWGQTVTIPNPIA